jgi:Skp family chaperone for outer membrane proteins
MSYWNLIRPSQQVSALSVLALLLVISPSAQAIPRSTAKIAIPSTPICFIERSNQSAVNLDRLCGKGAKRSKANPNGILDLSIDANRDGISDQLLDFAQQFLDTQENIQKEYQNRVGKLSEAELGALNDKNNALYAKLSDDFNARMPYSDRVKQLFAEEKRALEQFGKLKSPSDRDVQAIGAKQTELYQKYSKDPSFIRVEQAQRKVYKEIERRGSAKWLYSPPSS